MKRKKRIVIIGSGISGLTSAFLLMKEGYECVVLEKEPKPGGCVQTIEKQGLLMEQGPRVFKVSRCPDLLQLIADLGLSSDLMFSEKGLAKYLWTDGCLQKMPSGVWEFLSSRLCRPLLFSLLTEWAKPVKVEDETIWDFGCRRLGPLVTERFLEPLISGVYAGDLKQLSVLSCLTQAKEWERRWGSLTKGALASTVKRKKRDGSLFSLQRGMGSLIERLIEETCCPILYGQTALSCEKQGGQFFVTTDQGVAEGDAVMIALPAGAAGALLKGVAPAFSSFLSQVKSQVVTSVNVILKGDLLPVTGFGYLVPKKEGDSLLGVLFDSAIFTKQRDVTHTKMTLMIRGIRERKEVEEIVKRVLTTQLGIDIYPLLISSAVYEPGIPQYGVNHKQEIDALRESLPLGVHLIGNYIEGVSVNDCVRLAREEVEKILSNKDKGLLLPR